MDSFTEKILERARERQKKLLGSDTAISPLKESNGMKAESMPHISTSPINSLELLPKLKSNSDSDSKISTDKSPINDQNFILKQTASEGNLAKIIKQKSSKTYLSSDMPGSPQSQFKTLNIQKENFNMEIKLSSSENVRLEVQLQEEDGFEEKENVGGSLQEMCNETNDSAPVIRENAKKRLRQLGKLYAGGEDANLSSPIHRTEQLFSAETGATLPSKEKSDTKLPTSTSPSKSRKGLGGLAALAQTITEWEDNTKMVKKDLDDKKSNTPKKSWKPPAPRPPIAGGSKSVDDSIVTQKVKHFELPQKLKSQAPRPPIDINVKATKSTQDIAKNSEEEPKQLNLDPTLLKTLESQGFTRTTSNSRLIYKYNSGQNCTDDSKQAEVTQSDCIEEESEKNEIKMEKEINKNKIPCSPSKNNIRRNAIASKAAIFENVSSPSKNSNNGKDPALLSLSERKALFEKNKGSAPVPKAPISMATPLNVDKSLVHNQKLSSPVKNRCEILSKTKTPSKYPAPRPPIRPTENDHVDSAYRIPAGQPGGIASKMAALFKNTTTISQQQIENDVKEQRQKEMDILLNRFHKNKEVVNDSQSESDVEEDVDETTAMITSKPVQILSKKTEGIPPPPPPPGPSSAGKKRKSGGKRCSTEDSPKVAAVLDDVKRIKVSSKPGRLYPCLSDIETATETEAEQNTAEHTPNSSYEGNSYESDPDAAETSFGREVLETVCKNHSASSQKRLIYDDSTESDVSGILDDMDDYLDEAIAYNAENGPTPPKQGRTLSPKKCGTQSSSSFQYKDFSSSKESPQKPSSSSQFTSPLKSVSDRKSNEFPTYVVDGDNVLPLTHTVSFYRRQQNQTNKTPVRQVVRQPAIDEEKLEEKSFEENKEVKTKIQELFDEITKQQTIISQTSQALNLCYSTPEFTGSTEQVEAERVLLLASHRRAATQREIERLTVLKTLHSENGSFDKGSLTISNIVLPLKRDYVRALNATGGKGHHVICLIKCADQVICTKLVSTVATKDPNPDLELHIPGTIVLDNIYSDFTVQFEVYCLRAQEEIIPHEIKYHINNKKSSSKSTPKKSKAENRLIRPPKESPGGPQAVRSPTFALMGYVIFSIQGINRKNWTLNNTPSMSPLEGIVEMRVKCEIQVSVEHRGFLTMFEDVSGFGAWHRRWCLLKGNALNYWKYPDDEKRKAPIDTINLKNCITKQIGLVRRDICARPNTILIETTRSAQPRDKNSLVMERKGEITIIRHLLAADTKEEGMEWCTMFNKSLNVAKVNGNSK